MSEGRPRGASLTLVRQGLAGVRRRIGTRPAFFFTLYGVRRKTRRLRVRRTSRIVIEGFPRSANSFAVLAFAAAQGETAQALGVAHHLHVPAQIRLGIEFGIPTLVLARQPVDAVVSLLLREPWRSFNGSFAEYCTFYRTVLRYPESGYVVGLFSDVTSRFGSVIDSVNRRFDCSFRPFEHSEESVRSVFDQLESLESGGGRVWERGVARPSAERDRLKAELERRLVKEVDAGLVREAERLFDSVRRKAEVE